MKKLMIAMLLAVSAFAAAPQVILDGSTSWERDRVLNFERSLNFSNQPMVSTWYITVLPKEEFEDNVRRLKVDTVSAYTFVGLGRTYINEDYLTWSTDEQIRQTIAHESGHLICECSSEERANEIAYEVEK